MDGKRKSRVNENCLVARPCFNFSPLWDPVDRCVILEQIGRAGFIFCNKYCRVNFIQNSNNVIQNKKLKYEKEYKKTLTKTWTVTTSKSTFKLTLPLWGYEKRSPVSLSNTTFYGGLCSSWERLKFENIKCHFSENVSWWWSQKFH